MLIVQPVLYTVLELVVLAGIGFALRRLGVFSASFFQTTSNFIVQIALPIYLFATTASTTREQLASSGPLPLAAAAIIAVPLAVSIALVSIARLSGPRRQVGVALGTFGNAAYLPLSIIEILHVTEPNLAKALGGALPSLYVGAYLLVYSPTLWSVGNLILTRDGERGSRVRARDIITPPFVGVAAGFVVVITGAQGALLDARLPFFPVFRALELLGQVTFPLILVTLGAMIANLGVHEIRDRESIRLVLVVSLARVIILPGLFFLAYFTILRPLGAGPALLFVVFLEATVPPATNFSVMAGRAEVNEDPTAFTLLVTYALYLVTLPLYLVLFLRLPGLFGAA